MVSFYQNDFAFVLYDNNLMGRIMLKDSFTKICGCSEGKPLWESPIWGSSFWLDIGVIDSNQALFYGVSG